MHLFRVILCISSVFLISGCLKTRQDVQQARYSGEVQDRLSNLQKSVADKNAEFDQVYSELRSLAGRVESLEAAQNSGNRAANSQQEALAGQLQSQSQQLALLEQELTKISTQIQTLQQQMAKGGGTRSAQGDRDSQDNLGNYGGAEQAFNAKNWKEAILGFEKYRELNPGGRRFAESTYKIGFSFQQLGMRPEAKAFYEEVIAKSPNSDWAKAARSQLKKL